MDEPLRIGGVRLDCSQGYVEGWSRPNGVRKRKGNRRAGQGKRTQALQDEASSSDSELMDYAENLLNKSGHLSDSNASSSASESEQSKTDAFNLAEDAELGSGPRIEDLILSGVSSDSSDLESDSEVEKGSISESQLDAALDQCIADASELLQRYPVQSRTNAEASGVFQSQSRRQKTAKGTGQPKRSQSASLVPRRNVHGRKIDQQPVTNKQLKQERVQAKRTARAAQQGLSLRKINKTLHDFVCAEGDLEAFPPMDKSSRDYVRKLASLYGLKYSEQGAKGKRSFVMVRSTRRSKVPQGRAKVELTAILEQFSKMAAPVQPPSPAPGPLAHSSNGKITPGTARKSRLPQSTQSPREAPRRTSIGFVASGALNDLEPDTVVVVQSITSRQSQAPSSEGIGASSLAAQTLDPYSMDQGACNVSLEEAAMGQAAAAVAEAELTSSLPLAVANELQTCGIGYIEEPAELDLPEAVQNPSQPASSTGAADEAATSHNVRMSPAEGGAHQIEGLQQLAEGSPKAAEPLADRLEALAVVEDRCPSTGAASIPAYDVLEAKTKPSILRTKAQCKKAQKKLAKEQRRAAKSEGVLPQGSGFEQSGLDVGLHYGQFERHTRGIGSKLMEQMGYLGAGTGLGREKQGIAEPLKAAQRPKNLGLGA